jgi:CRISPR-associated protein Cmr3
MTGWMIEPRDPLIVRDGRPFDPQPGVVATTLPFPFPSTTAGAARTRAGSQDGIFTAHRELATLQNIQIRGPLLVEFQRDGQERLLVPTPGDALLLEGNRPLRCKQLVPLQPFARSLVSPAPGPDGMQLATVGPEEYEAAKAAKNLPTFWYWEQLVRWLLDPAQINVGLSREALGLGPLLMEQRMHVAMESDRRVAREGALFTTIGLEFTASAADFSALSQARRLALWLDVAEHPTYRIAEELASLGGERRLVTWRKSGLDLKKGGAMPGELCARIKEARACRLVLLTPACFQQGYLPSLARWAYGGVKPELHAALVQRPQVVSGWDLAAGKAKPTRRLAPAGSVFFLKFPAADSQAIASWAEHFWMSCVSDEEQARKDGFGLAVLGTWDGCLKPMRLKGA